MLHKLSALKFAKSTSGTLANWRSTLQSLLDLSCIMMHSYIEGFMAELVFLNHWMNGLNEFFCIGIMDGTSVVQRFDCNWVGNMCITAVSLSVGLPTVTLKLVRFEFYEFNHDSWVVSRESWLISVVTESETQSHEKKSSEGPTQSIKTLWVKSQPEMKTVKCRWRLVSLKVTCPNGSRRRQQQQLEPAAGNQHRGASTSTPPTTCTDWTLPS